MSLFYKQNVAARFFVDQTNGKVYEVVGGSGLKRVRYAEQNSAELNGGRKPLL